MKLFLVLATMFFSNVTLAAVGLNDYELIAASQTAQVMGPDTITTKTGQILEKLIIVPETTAAGTVAIKDGSGTAINVFVAGTLSDLHTIVIPINAISVTGSWQVTTGANVHVIAVGRFN